MYRTEEDIEENKLKVIDNKFFIKDRDVTKVLNDLSFAGSDFPKNQEVREIILWLENAINNAEILNSKLLIDQPGREVLNLAGMSSMKNRIFLNEVCSDENNMFKNKNYLEIGCAAGSTYISANYNNNLNSSYVCDTFNEGKNEKNGKEIFLNNCKRYLKRRKMTLFDEDCFGLDLAKIKDKINIYFFDGGHSVRDHEMSLTYFEDVFDKNIVFIIDDWNDQRVQIGTILGLSKIGYDISWWSYCPSHFHLAPFAGINIQRKQLKTDDLFGDKYRWWNGTLSLVLSRRENK